MEECVRGGRGGGVCEVRERWSSVGREKFNTE